jgi:hypothetical protein
MGHDIGRSTRLLVRKASGHRIAWSRRARRPAGLHARFGRESAGTEGLDSARGCSAVPFEAPSSKRLCLAHTPSIANLLSNVPLPNPETGDLVKARGLDRGWTAIGVTNSLANRLLGLLLLLAMLTCAKSSPAAPRAPETPQR